MRAELWVICVQNLLFNMPKQVLREVSYTELGLQGQWVVIRYCSQPLSEPATENRWWLEGGCWVIIMQGFTCPCSFPWLHTCIGSGAYRGKLVLDFHWFCMIFHPPLGQKLHACTAVCFTELEFLLSLSQTWFSLHVYSYILCYTLLWYPGNSTAAPLLWACHITHDSMCARTYLV